MTKYKTNTVSTRLNDDQIEILDMKAKKDGVTRAELLKHIILNYLADEVNSQNLMLGAISSIQERLEKNDTKTEFLLQLFHAYLAMWFQSHPLSGEGSAVKAKAAIEQRDKFEKKFINSVFNRYESLFSKLLATNIEENGEEGEDE